jgi:hypothetical protein
MNRADSERASQGRQGPRSGTSAEARRATEQGGGTADVVYVLCLLQAGFVMLAGFGELLLMGGNPAYLVMPVAKVTLLILLAAKVVTGRRWAMITLIVLQGVTLIGFWLQVIAGLTPWLDYTVNLVGLITNVAMPLGLVYLCSVLLARTPRRRAATTLPVPQDPYLEPVR